MSLVQLDNTSCPYTLGSLGVSWNTVGSLGVPWDPLACFGFPWGPLGCLATRWGALGNGSDLLLGRSGLLCGEVWFNFGQVLVYVWFRLQSISVGQSSFQR